MLKFTAMSCQREFGGKKIEGFASINVTINDLGAMSMQLSCFDSHYNALGRMISKLPVIRKSKTITDFQNRMRLAIENIVDENELVVGSCRRDISVFSQLIREFRKTDLNDGSSILDIQKPIVELLDEIPKSYGVRSNRDVADYYGIDFSLVQELACIVFDVDYYDDLPECAVRASLYCCIKLEREGYDLEDVLSSTTEFMRQVNGKGVTDGAMVKLSKKLVAG